MTDVKRDIAGALPDGMALRILARAPFAIMLTHPTLADAFERATGYSRAGAIGRNCRFLQEAETDERTVQKLRHGIGSGSEVAADILNYRADGSPFWNRLMVAPLHDSDGALAGLEVTSGENGTRVTLDVPRSARGPC